MIRSPSPHASVDPIGVSRTGPMPTKRSAFRSGFSRPGRMTCAGNPLYDPGVALLVALLPRVAVENPAHVAHEEAPPGRDGDPAALARDEAQVLELAQRVELGR